MDGPARHGCHQHVYGPGASDKFSCILPSPFGTVAFGAAGSSVSAVEVQERTEALCKIRAGARHCWKTSSVHQNVTGPMKTSYSEARSSYQSFVLVQGLNRQLRVLPASPPVTPPWPHRYLAVAPLIGDQRCYGEVTEGSGRGRLDAWAQN